MLCECLGEAARILLYSTDFVDFILKSILLLRTATTPSVEQDADLDASS